MPNILVVEDDENLNRGITFSLKKSGYEVFSAESVKKANGMACCSFHNDRYPSLKLNEDHQHSGSAETGSAGAGLSTGAGLDSSVQRYATVGRNICRGQNGYRAKPLMNAKGNQGGKGCCSDGAGSEERKHRNTNTLPGSVDRIWNFDGGIVY